MACDIDNIFLDPPSAFGRAEVEGIIQFFCRYPTAQAVLGRQSLTIALNQVASATASTLFINRYDEAHPEVLESELAQTLCFQLIQSVPELAALFADWYEPTPAAEPKPPQRRRPPAGVSVQQAVEHATSDCELSAALYESHDPWAIPVEGLAFFQLDDRTVVDDANGMLTQTEPNGYCRSQAINNLMMSLYFEGLAWQGTATFLNGFTAYQRTSTAFLRGVAPAMSQRVVDTLRAAHGSEPSPHPLRVRAAAEEASGSSSLPKWRFMKDLRGSRLRRLTVVAPFCCLCCCRKMPVRA